MVYLGPMMASHLSRSASLSVGTMVDELLQLASTFSLVTSCNLWNMEDVPAAADADVSSRTFGTLLLCWVCEGSTASVPAADDDDGYFSDFERGLPRAKWLLLAQLRRSLEDEGLEVSEDTVTEVEWPSATTTTEAAAAAADAPGPGG